MLNQPPSIPTSLSPPEIIGWEMEQTFLHHYRIANSGTEYPEKRLATEFTADQMASIADIYKELRANGFYPLGFNEKGQIRWGTALQGVTTTILEKDLQNNPVTDIEAEKAKARGTFKLIGTTSQPMMEMAA